MSATVKHHPFREVSPLTKRSRTFKNWARCPFNRNTTLSLIYCQRDPQTLRPANSSCMLKIKAIANQKSLSIQAHRCNSSFIWPEAGNCRTRKRREALTFAAFSSNGVNLIIIVQSARSSRPNFLRRFLHLQLNHVAQSQKITH